MRALPLSPPMLNQHRFLPPWSIAEPQRRSVKFAKLPDFFRRPRAFS